MELSVKEIIAYRRAIMKLKIPSELKRELLKKAVSKMKYTEALKLLNRLN